MAVRTRNRRPVRRRYNKRNTGTTAAATPVGEPQFNITQDEIDNPTVPKNPDYAKTNLDVVKELNPSLNNSEGRMILKAQDRVKQAEENYVKKSDLYRKYLDSWTDEESDDEKEARKAKDLKARRLAAVFDGLTALGNLGGAMAGATPITPAKSLTQAQQERMLMAKKLRDADHAKKYKMYEQHGKVIKKDYEDAKKAYDEALKNETNENYRAQLLANTRGAQAATEANRVQQQENWDKTFTQKQKKDAHDMQHQDEMIAIGRENAVTNRIRALKPTGGGRSSNSASNEETKILQQGRDAAVRNPGEFNNWLANQNPTLQMGNQSDQWKAFGTFKRQGGNKEKVKKTPKVKTTGRSALR